MKGSFYIIVHAVTYEVSCRCSELTNDSQTSTLDHLSASLLLIDNNVEFDIYPVYLMVR